MAHSGLWTAFLAASLAVPAAAMIGAQLDVLSCCAVGIVVAAAWWLAARQRGVITGLQDKAVLISGCDTGFGNLCARRLDALGVTVFAGCLFPDGPGAAQLRASTSNNLHVVALDVTKDDHVKDAVKYVEKNLGHKVMWAVINNAGVAMCGEVGWIPTEDLIKCLNVNTVGVYRLSQAFLPLIRRSHGRVICICSIMGRVAIPGAVAYSMSKHAVAAFADGLRREMQKWSVTVHSIEPHFYKTDLTLDSVLSEKIEKAWSSSPQDVRDDYGQKYIEIYKKSVIASIRWIESANLDEVVDDMVDAAIGSSPQDIYRPGLLRQVPVILKPYSPTFITDFAVRFMTGSSYADEVIKKKWQLPKDVK